MITLLVNFPASTVFRGLSAPVVASVEAERDGIVVRVRTPGPPVDCPDVTPAAVVYGPSAPASPSCTPERPVQAGSATGMATTPLGSAPVARSGIVVMASPAATKPSRTLRSPSSATTRGCGRAGHAPNCGSPRAPCPATHFCPSPSRYRARPPTSSAPLGWSLSSGSRSTGGWPYGGARATPCAAAVPAIHRRPPSLASRSTEARVSCGPGPTQGPTGVRGPGRHAHAEFRGEAGRSVSGVQVAGRWRAVRSGIGCGAGEVQDGAP